ncbi:MAG: hypothetical protein ABI651_03615 [Verrucomicrobiota bacterium]
MTRESDLRRTEDIDGAAVTYAEVKPDDADRLRGPARLMPKLPCISGPKRGMAVDDTGANP